MKDYKKELDNYEYDKRYNLPDEHKWDSLADESEQKKFESLEHSNQTYEVGEGVRKTAKELLTPEYEVDKRDLKQSSPEITGQHEALPLP